MFHFINDYNASLKQKQIKLTTFFNSFLSKSVQTSCTTGVRRGIWGYEWHIMIYLRGECKM